MASCFLFFVLFFLRKAAPEIPQYVKIQIVVTKATRIAAENVDTYDTNQTLKKKPYCTYFAIFQL